MGLTVTSQTVMAPQVESQRTKSQMMMAQATNQRDATLWAMKRTNAAGESGVKKLACYLEECGKAHMKQIELP